MSKLTEMPLVSVITIFYNAAAFMQEAIDSVLDQSYSNWELLLVDDGSSDSSTEIAKELASKFPAKVRYLEHHDHLNKGMSASRNLGINNALGEYICFLDADDMWKPNKLFEQVTIMLNNPEVKMLYGNTLFWWSWKNDSRKKDVLPGLGVKTGVINPPELIPKFLNITAAVPATCSIMCRKQLFNRIMFEDAFTGLYEDQAFYYKICLTEPVYVSDSIWDKYRQHPSSACYIAGQNGELYLKRLEFLKWLWDFISSNDLGNKTITRAILQEFWRNHFLCIYQNKFLLSIIRPLLKKFLRLERLLVPESISNLFWVKSSAYKLLVNTESPREYFQIGNAVNK